MEGEAIELERARPLAQKVTQAVVHAVLADLVVQPELDALEREIGYKRLRAGREGNAARVELRVEVFEPRAPVRSQGDLDAGSSGPACSRHHKPAFQRSGCGGPTDRRSAQLRAGKLVIAESETTRCIDQPVAGSVTEASANGAEELHQLREARCTGGRRGKCLAALDRVGEGDVGFSAQHDAAGQDDVVAGLQAGKVAAGALERIEALREIKRAAKGHAPCG